MELGNAEAGSGGSERWLKIPLDCTRPSITFATRALSVVRKTPVVPFFGPTTGFVVNYSPDRAVRFDLDGNPVEVLPMLAAVKNHTFFGDGQAKGGLGEMPSAAVGTQSRACIPVDRGSAGNPPCDAPLGWTATERTRSADLAVLSTVTSRTKR
jgi:hypothetical protein